MARLPRKLLRIAILFVILINTWFLARRYYPETVNGKPNVDSLEVPVENPAFNSNKHGKSWSKDPKYFTSGSNAAVGPEKGNAPKNLSKDKHGSSHPAVSEEEGISHASQGSFFNAYASNYKAGMGLVKSVLDTIAEIAPGVQPLKTYNRNIQADTALEESHELPSTSTVLGMYLQVNDEDTAKLAKSHQMMMDQLPRSVPKNSFKGRGVVLTGGGMYFPMVLTAIRWFREIDTETPIEVFMADKSEYEPHICDNLFPKLNVECRVLRDIYGVQLSEKLDSKYALKPLAILASKFDDVYFMDADSYPLIDINSIFNWKVYKDTGLILNSDYWPRYISPKFYEIVNIKLGGRARGDPKQEVINQSDRKNAVPGKSTESGQVFVQKSKHIQSLLLAMYYNLYGPDYYFPLLMQGGHGEGDKDTYAAAAIICGEKYYQTQRRPATLGQHLPGGVFKGYAMVQPNPISDYERIENSNSEVPETFFALHANSIKSNPRYLLQSHVEPIRGAPPLRQQRVFGDMANIKRELLKSDDLELNLFKAMAHVSCIWAAKYGYVPRDWEEVDLERQCRLLTKHTQWLAENPNTSFDENAPFWIDLA